MHNADVLADQIFRHAFKVTGGKVVEVGHDFAGIKLAIEIFQDALLSLHARLFDHRDKLLDATEGARGVVIELPEQEVLPVGIGAPGAVPCVSA